MYCPIKLLFRMYQNDTFKHMPNQRRVFRMCTFIPSNALLLYLFIFIIGMILDETGNRTLSNFENIATRKYIKSLLVHRPTTKSPSQIA